MGTQLAKKERMRALVIEDDESTRSLLQDMVLHHGFHPIPATTAEEGLAIHGVDPVDLVVLDWSLPRMDGLDFCRALRASEQGSDAYVVMVTGRRRAQDLQAALDAGADDYIAKPMTQFDVHTRLTIATREILERRRRQRAETAISALETRMRLAERMASIGTLAAGVAHEINNPLSFVLSNVGWLSAELDQLAEGSLPQDRMTELREVLADTASGAERVRRIVTDLRTFSRGDDEALGPVQLEPLIRTTANLAGVHLKHRARLVLDVDETAVARGNASRLGQVFLNLLVNAAQAIPPGAPDTNLVEVKNRRDPEGRVVVSIRDTGAGIPQDHVARVFDPFFTTKSVGEGTGLGLAVCHNLITLMNGEIWFESEPGGGTVFHIALPDANPDVASTTPMAPPQGQAGAPPLTSYRCA